MSSYNRQYYNNIVKSAENIGKIKTEIDGVLSSKCILSNKSSTAKYQIPTCDS